MSDLPEDELFEDGDVEASIALDIPLLPIDEEPGQYVIFLPGVRTEELEDITYEVDEEEEMLRIYCVYGTDEEGIPTGDMFPINLGESNREHLENMEKLAVLNPRDHDPEELARDPDDRKQLQNLFEALLALEDQLGDESDS